MIARQAQERIHDRLFDAIYTRSLVYNTCWEDPAVDRKALRLTGDDRIVMITSAGCNALDYALDRPARIDAVDANPRQTALLELKIAGIRTLAFDDFFALFGEGSHPRARELFGDVLRWQLSRFARDYWERRIRWFDPDAGRGSFYFHGLSGMVARGFHGYCALRPRLRAAIEELLAAQTLDEQREIYDSRAAPALWSRQINWALSRQFTMSMLGVPCAQHAEVRRQHRSGVPGFVRDSIDYVFRELPLRNNYFWRLYLTGRYTRDCAPEYLVRSNFEALKAGLVDRIHLHTGTLTSHLQEARGGITRFVLLDHMDWMSTKYPGALAEEWDALLLKAATGARVLFRSAHASPDYLDGVTVNRNGRRHGLREILAFHPELARELTRSDRVHTYAGFHVADIVS